VNIDLPHQLVHMRAKAVESKAVGSGAERAAFALWARAMGSAGAYQRATRAARFGAGTFAKIGWKPGPLAAWARHREIPTMASETFKEWWSKRQALPTSSGAS
jgi:L-lactate dehydrogenase complex protein LldF